MLSPAIRFCGGLGLAVAVATSPARAQESPYQLGEQVELKAGGDHWQKCVVIDPGAAERVMRMRCEPYEGPGYSRGGGVYTESMTSTDVRRGETRARPVAARAAALPARGGGYSVGQQVEIEASEHWVPCTVSEIQMYGDQPLIRVRCEAYPALSRAAGTYIVHDIEAGIRPATGRIGLAPQPSPRAVARQPATGRTLPAGEYACYGSGGQIMAGLGFKLLGGGRYTDLDGATSGRFTITGSTITFSGGHLDGQTGREINGKSFRIGAQATCEHWG